MSYEPWPIICPCIEFSLPCQERTAEFSKVESVHKLFKEKIKAGDAEKTFSKLCPAPIVTAFKEDKEIDVAIADGTVNAAPLFWNSF